MRTVSIALLALLTACATTTSSVATSAAEGGHPAGPAWGALPAALARDPAALTPELLAFSPRQPEVFQLENGLAVYYLPDETIPLVEVRLIVRAGSIYEPAAQAGLASFAAQSLRAGGAGERSPEALDEALDALGANLSLGASSESTSATLSLLSRDADAGFAILADVLLRPRLDAQRLEVLRLSETDKIARRRDDPAGEAWRALRKAVYGPTSPWARESTTETLRRLDGGAVRAWHGRFFQPGGSILVVTGDLEKKRALALAEQHFGAAAWPAKEVVLPDVPLHARDGARKVILVPRPIAQAKVRIGHLGYRRHDPQQQAFMLADSVFGGAMFVSRLAREVRSTRGLAYSAYSMASPGPEAGLVAIALDTKNDQAASAIEVSLELLEAMDTAPQVTSEELARAKDLFINQFAFRFATASDAAMERAIHDFHGYPDDYLPTFREKIAAVTQGTINAAARALYNARDAVIVVVGDPAKLGDLSRFGDVVRIEDVEAWR